MNYRLTINSQLTPATPDYALRFYEDNGQVTPTLYYRGSRVAQPWTLELHHEQPADPAPNANTT